jgi:hypothetical protein
MFYVDIFLYAKMGSIKIIKKFFLHDKKSFNADIEVILLQE